MAGSVYIIVSTSVYSLSVGGVCIVASVILPRQEIDVSRVTVSELEFEGPFHLTIHQDCHVRPSNSHFSLVYSDCSLFFMYRQLWGSLRLGLLAPNTLNS